MVSVEVFKAAVSELLGLKTLHIMVETSGISAALILSVIEIWKHVAGGTKI